MGDGGVVDDAAGYQVVGFELAAAREGVKCCEAPAAGDDGVAPGAVGAGVRALDDEAANEAVGGDGGGELGQRIAARGGLAHVLGRELELAQGMGRMTGLVMGFSDLCGTVGPPEPRL